MDGRAVEKAKSRLRVATRAVELLGRCATFQDFSDTWYEFLVGAKGVYTLLEKGSKVSPQSRQWFGAKNNDRRKDELLRYVTEARNSDEHGLEPVAEYVPSSLHLGVSDPSASRHVVDEYGNTFKNNGTAIVINGATRETKPPRLRALDGRKVAKRFAEAHVKLIRVYDRSGLPQDPPNAHMGTVMPDQSPQTVATATIRYLSNLIAEAERLSKP